MPFTITMPKLSTTMTEGTIAKWLKKPGEYVEAGDVLVEIATDKATVEHNALDAGWLKKIIKNNGEKAAVNEPLAVFTVDEKESIDGYEPEGIEAPKKAAPTTKAPLAPSPKPVAAQAAPKPTPKPQEKPVTSTIMPPTPRKERVLASPLAKNLARDRGVDIANIKGSGPHGRIMARDLDQPQTRPQESQLEILPVEEIPLTPMRQVIAERLQYSKSTIPHFYIHQEVDVEPLVKLREETKKLEKSFTVNDFIIKATAIALQKHPVVNASFDPDRNIIIRHPHVDLSIAVTIPGGLITPIVKNAAKKSLTHISQEIKQLAGRAKEGKLAPEEYQGGSFTISNLGMYGVTSFQAIVNPPQTAILAVGTVQDKPVVRNGQVVPGKMLSITLSCDHRAIDGAEAAQFMQTLKQLLENPVLFLAE